MGWIWFLIQPGLLRNWVRWHVQSLRLLAAISNPHNLIQTTRSNSRLYVAVKGTGIPLTLRTWGLGVRLPSATPTGRAVQVRTYAAASSVRCKSCASTHRQPQAKYNLLTRDELKQLIRSTSFVEIGKQYNVSDNAVRKWCEKYDLPRTKQLIKSYSDEEWNKI